MQPADLFRAVEVGEGAGDAERAVIAARAAPLAEPWEGGGRIRSAAVTAGTSMSKSMRSSAGRRCASDNRARSTGRVLADLARTAGFAASRSKKLSCITRLRVCSYSLNWRVHSAFVATVVHFMILEQVVEVRSPEPRVAWSSMQKYLNVNSVTDSLIRLHNLPTIQKRNAQKQARQLRYCLIQAREYATAASAVSLATKPALHYYSVMSLALAEILLKQSGESSLDRAREHHRHHGLLFSDIRSGILSEDLRAAASGLVAKPMISMQHAPRRMGTFELWHRSAREYPYVGEFKQHLSVGGIHSSHACLAIPTDDRLPLFPVEGLSLFDCLTHIPDMLVFLNTHGFESACLRGKIARDDFEARPRSVLTFTIHPSTHASAFLKNMEAHPELVNRLDYRAFPSGGSITLTSDPVNYSPVLSLPPGCATNTNEFRCWTGPKPLNEFGYIYAALFIAGNYARYYPDRWVLDVENSTPLALAIEELLTIAETRMPWLILSELSRAYHVYVT
jgi:hypothetical protein